MSREVPFPWQEQHSSTPAEEDASEEPHAPERLGRKRSRLGRFKEQAFGFLKTKERLQRHRNSPKVPNIPLGHIDRNLSFNNSSKSLISAKSKRSRGSSTRRSFRSAASSIVHKLTAKTHRRRSSNGHLAVIDEETLKALNGSGKAMMASRVPQRRKLISKKKPNEFKIEADPPPPPTRLELESLSLRNESPEAGASEESDLDWEDFDLSDEEKKPEGGVLDFGEFEDELLESEGSEMTVGDFEDVSEGVEEEEDDRECFRENVWGKEPLV